MGDIGLDSTLLERIYPELKPGPASSPVEAEVQELKQKAKPQSPEPLFGGSRTGTSSAGITQSRTDDTEMAWLQAPGGGAKSDTTNKSKGLGVTITGHGTSGQRTANTIASSLEGYNSKNPDKKLGLSYEDGKFTVGNSSHLSKQDLTSLISQHQYDGWHPIIEGKNKEGNWQIGLSPIGPKVESLPRNNSSRPVDRSEATDKDTGKATNKSRRNGQTNYIADKDPDDINTKHQKTGKELAEQVKPLDSKIPYNAEQLTTAPDSEVDITANQRFIDSNRKSEVNSKSPASTLNYNADIGGQEAAKHLRDNGVLVKKDENGNEKPAYVLISHGHAPAIAKELGSWTTKGSDGKEKYLYDTSMYMPMGQWKPDTTSRTGVATGGVQMWGDQIAADKQKIKEQGLESAGGVAIALNGHRGDLNIGGGIPGTANIDPVKMLGTPEEFAKELERRGLDRVVVATEHFIRPGKTIQDPNILTLEHLGGSTRLMREEGGRGYTSFDFANEDLSQYMKDLQKVNPKLEIMVVGVDGRSAE